MNTRSGEERRRPKADAFQAVDLKLQTLRARLGTAREELDVAQASMERERAAYRQALAEGDDATPPATRTALEGAERGLRRIEDLVAGCEQAIATLEPEWKRARVGMLQEQNGELSVEIIRLEQRLQELQAEVEARRREMHDAGAAMQDLLNKQRVRAAEIQQLLQELHGLVHRRGD